MTKCSLNQLVRFAVCVGEQGERPAHMRDVVAASANDVCLHAPHPHALLQLNFCDEVTVVQTSPHCRRRCAQRRGRDGPRPFMPSW